MRRWSNVRVRPQCFGPNLIFGVFLIDFIGNIIAPVIDQCPSRTRRHHSIGSLSAARVCVQNLRAHARCDAI